MAWQAEEHIDGLDVEIVTLKAQILAKDKEIERLQAELDKTGWCP